MSSDPSVSHPNDDESYSGWIGRVVDGRYRIDGLLGEGGMGAVFDAEHLKLMKQVALKVIHPEFAGDGEVAERFAREAMASAQMDHPHIAGAIDYGTLPEGGAYLVMQFVRGDSLRDVLEDEGALGWARACEIGNQIADALAEAHKRRIVHRDLKPDNVMLEPRDDGSHLVKVLDFGIARVADEKISSGGPALTRVGTVIGTPGYMAPEQALGEPVDFRVDLYALGLLLYEMVTGTRLFDLDDLTAIVTRQLTEDAPRVSEKGFADVPARLDQLIHELLRKDKNLRPASAAAVRDTLREILLDATLQRVASGEHKLPMLSTRALADAAREPTGRRPVTSSATDPHEASAIAPTMAVSTARRPTANAPDGSKAPEATRAARPKRSIDVTAHTALAMDAVRKNVEKVPVPARFGLGCALAAVAALLFVGVGWMIFGGDEPPPLIKVEHREPMPLPEPTPAPAASAGAIPTELAQPFADLLLEDTTRARRAAARLVLAHQPREAIPPFLVAIAELETARRCEDRKAQVLALQQLGDSRALPVLERLAEDTSQCGNVFRRYDCQHCLRTELSAAIQSLRSAM